MIKIKYKVALLAVVVAIVGAVITTWSVGKILRYNDSQSFAELEISNPLFPPPPPWTLPAPIKFPPIPKDVVPATSTQSKKHSSGIVREPSELFFPENTLNTSNWQTYRNEKLGFQVKYPKDWKVVEYGPDMEMPTLIDGENVSLGEIRMYREKDDSIHAYEDDWVIIKVESKFSEQGIKKGLQKSQEVMLGSKKYVAYHLVEIIERRRIPFNSYVIETDILKYAIFSGEKEHVLEKILSSFNVIR